MLAIMDHSHLRENYREEDFNHGAWGMHTPDYHTQGIVSPAQHYTPFSFNQVPINNVYSDQMQPNAQAPYTPAWPSMITNPPHSTPDSMPGYSMAQMTYAPPQPLPPLITSPPVPLPPASSTSRRTLTDNDRRRMCQYHQEHPNTKQTEIGAMFGVERSTVSKVLRQKEKYLAQDDGSKSPVRRAKGKFPDIERALLNWADKQQQKGMNLTDDAIRDKARFFAASVGNPEATTRVNSVSWLEKFKQKNSIGVKGKRKTSSSGTPDVTTRVSRSPVLTPISPGTQEPASFPVSPEDRKPDLSRTPTTPDGGNADTTSAPPSTNGPSQSAAHFNDRPAAVSTIYEQQLAGLTEAMEQQQQQQQQQQPIQHEQQHTPTQEQNQMPHPGSESTRSRNQSYPTLEVQTSGHNLSEHYTGNNGGDMMAHPALETSQHGFAGRSLSSASMTSADLSHLQHQHPHSHPSSMLGTPVMDHSPSVMMTHPSSLHPVSATSSNVASPVTSLSVDHGRQGLEMALNYIGTLPPGVVDPQEYQVLSALSEKLRTFAPSRN